MLSACNLRSQSRENCSAPFSPNRLSRQLLPHLSSHFPSKWIQDALCLFPPLLKKSQRTFPCVSFRLLNCSVGFLSKLVLNCFMISCLQSLWHNLAQRSCVCVCVCVFGPLHCRGICLCLSRACGWEACALGQWKRNEHSKLAIGSNVLLSGDVA